MRLFGSPFPVPRSQLSGSQPDFLPMSRAELDALGWDELDVLLVSGSAYVDHPAFGEALLGRLLVAVGFRVGVVALPDWRTPDPLKVMGRPRLFVGVTAGALDSMVAHYTAFRRPRRDDAYAPGGKAGRRPNRAALVYANLCRQAFPGLPVVLGGIEASMRRAVHYDFWTDKMRRPLGLDAKADLIIYGMAERALVGLARGLETGGRAGALRLHGVVSNFNGEPDPPAGAELRELPSFQAIQDDPGLLMEATLAVEGQVHGGPAGPWLFQRCGARGVLLAPPATRLTTEELDALYALPFSRQAHPSYREPIPALEMVRFSVTAVRGCGGGCTFCSLSLHQGRLHSSRSRGSILQEVRELTRHGQFRGTVSDIGGPTANLWGAGCSLPHEKWPCKRTSCLAPKICPHLESAQGAYLELLDQAAALPGVKHLRVASGVRHDLCLEQADFMRALVTRFTGGQLKVAPEHTEASVLKLMRKQDRRAFEVFVERFESLSARAGKEQYLVPYLLSGFPGCTTRDMERLASWFKARGWRPRQVQAFLPTPGTVATAMFAGGVDEKGRPIHVARSDGERRRQHELFGREKVEGGRRR